MPNVMSRRRTCRPNPSPLRRTEPHPSHKHDKPVCRDWDQPHASSSSPWRRTAMTGRSFVTRLCVALILFISPLQVWAQISGNLLIVGNGPEQATIEALARAFEKANPRAYVDIHWDEDSSPAQLVRTGQAQIAVTGIEDSTLAASQIGWDGIGIVVHLSNFTKEVTTQQVADVFSGTIREWSELGGPETRILLIDRSRTQNIRETFESHLGITGKIPRTATVIGSDDTVIKTVVGTLPPLSAVAYVSLNTGLSAVSNGVAVRLLPVDKIEPEIPTVRDGRYRLRRPLLLLSKKDSNPLIETFIAFALSPPGQAIVGELYVAMSGK
uniref:substrate-binding domain-containing protein n=1 Tax=Nitrospira cf. moscoviensis SBR1015 TaxID=96242 RepID=UPI000A3B0A96|nr:substrate-binding domain-containing protein [Nitrospira cf. moscoviensis SBR1015]